jgi:hypothetical protein
VERRRHSAHLHFSAQGISNHSLLISPDVVSSVGTASGVGATGRAAAVLQIPNAPALMGFVIDAQLFAEAPGSAPIGVLSMGSRIVIN